MKRTDADGFAPGNLYTEGNPTLGVPATVVGDEEMNNIQEEIVSVVLAAGLVLDGGNFGQLLAALNIIIGLGGSSQLKDDLDNNAGATAIVGLIFDSASIKSARVEVDLFRRTDTVAERRNETGTLFLSFDPEKNGGEWEDPVFVSHAPTSEEKNDSETTFTIDAATGQVKYTTTNFAGAAYSGTFRIWDIKTATL